MDLHFLERTEHRPRPHSGSAELSLVGLWFEYRSKETPKENCWRVTDNENGTEQLAMTSVRSVGTKEFCAANGIASTKDLDTSKTYKLRHPTGRLESGWRVDKVTTDGVVLSIDTEIVVQTHKDKAARERLLEVMPGADKSHVDEVHATLKQIPQNVLEFVQKSGFKIVVAPRITAALPHLSGVEPRGWGGLTFDNSDGTMDEARKLIVSPDKYLNGKKWEVNTRPHVVSHQIAHAIDAILENYSNSADFIRAYSRDIDAIPKSDRNHIYKYLTQRDFDAGRKEAYACIAGMLLTGPENPEDREYFEKHFPNLIALLRQQLKQLK